MKTACAQYSFWPTTAWSSLTRRSTSAPPVPHRRFITAGGVIYCVDTGVPPSRLLLEGHRVRGAGKPAGSIARIRQLKAWACRISIDDLFWATSLAHLARFARR